MAGLNGVSGFLDDIISYDVVGNTVGRVDDLLEPYSLINGDNKISNTIHEVATSAGNMLPSIAVSLIPGLGPVASKALSYATFGAGAGGQAVEEALNEGVDIKNATAYGLLSGGTEVGIEAISGALGGTTRIGKGALENVFGKGLGGVVKNFAEEGLEEVASTGLDVIWKNITYGDKYTTPELEELLADMQHSFITGGITATIMGGAGQVGNLSQYGVKGTKAVNTYNEILELNRSEYQLETKGKLTDKFSFL